MHSDLHVFSPFVKRLYLAKLAASIPCALPVLNETQLAALEHLRESAGGSYSKWHVKTAKGQYIEQPGFEPVPNQEVLVLNIVKRGEYNSIRFASMREIEYHDMGFDDTEGASTSIDLLVGKDGIIKSAQCAVKATFNGDYTGGELQELSAKPNFETKFMVEKLQALLNALAGEKGLNKGSGASPA